MRTTVVYILRLLVDDIEPGALRGILRNVTNGEEHAFSSEQALLEQLHSKTDNYPETTEVNQTNQVRRSDE